MKEMEVKLIDGSVGRSVFEGRVIRCPSALVAGETNDRIAGVVGRPDSGEFESHSKLKRESESFNGSEPGKPTPAPIRDGVSISSETS